jgi:HD superfamily phosphohydrolase
LNFTPARTTIPVGTMRILYARIDDLSTSDSVANQSASMRWDDRVYGQVSIEDPQILELVRSATFERLRGVQQAGPSALAFPFKDVTRFEHSLGVFILLRKLGAPRREQVAGLVHDISHTAFSHAVDFIVTSEEQDHHEQLKPLLLERPDIAQALERLGYSPREFFDDSIYPLLEQPIPLLCADRLDYFLRDGMACGVVDRPFATRLLRHLTVVESRIVLTDVEVAREAVRRYETMNHEWWASPTEAFIYNEFADALREAFRLGVLDTDDLMTEDSAVLATLDASGSSLIARKLDTIRQFRPECALGYEPRIVPKERWLDPPVIANGKVERFSQLKS